MPDPSPESYRDQVAPWPGRGQRPTAEALSRYHLVRGLGAGHVLFERGCEVFPLPEQVAGSLSHGLEHVAWMDGLRLTETVGNVVEVCYLLGRLHEVDPAAADDAAAWLVGMAAAGEQLEWLHATAQQDGIDVERVLSDADADWQDRGATTVELATAVADLARELVETDQDTGIELAVWPAASRLVTLAGAWPAEDDDQEDTEPDQPTDGNHDG